MPQRILPALFVLGVIALIWMAWQPAPALAGFTPTPRPQPTNTPAPPVDTPQPPPEKPPKDTPVPSATVSLTATPGVLPQAGGQIVNEHIPIIMLLVVFALIAAGAMIRPLVRTRR